MIRAQITPCSFFREKHAMQNLLLVTKASIRAARITIGLLLIAITASIWVHAQDDYKRKQFVIYVSVSDREHKAVSGLERKDFSLLMDRAGLPLESCEEILPPRLDPTDRQLARRSLQGSGNLASSFQNTFHDAQNHGHVIIFLLDKVNATLGSEAFARQQLAKSLTQLRKGDLDLVLLSLDRNGLSVLVDVTDDPQILVDYLKAHSGETAGEASADIKKALVLAKSEIPDASIGPSLLIDPNQVNNTTSLSAYLTLDIFAQIAQAFAYSSGKYDLIWFTSRIPFGFYTKAQNTREGWAAEFVNAMNLLAHSDIQLRTIFIGSRAASSAAVTTPAAGVIHNDAYPTGVVGAPTIARSGSVTTPNVTHSGVWAVEEFTKASGGRAYESAGGITRALKDIVEQSAATYKLTFFASPKIAPLTWAPIELGVKRNSLQVTSANGIYSYPAVEPELMRRYDIARALRTPLQFTSLTIKGNLSTTSKSALARQATFKLYLPPGQIKINETDGNHMSLDVAYAVLDQNNKLVTGKSLPYDTNLDSAKRDELNQKGVSMSNSFEIAPGRYTVRFIARDNLSGNIGSVFVPLTVE
jgi:VWFA-related protein